MKTQVLGTIFHFLQSRLRLRLLVLIVAVVQLGSLSSHAQDYSIRISETLSRVDSLVQIPIQLQGGSLTLGGFQFAITYNDTHLSNSTERLGSNVSKLISGKIDQSELVYNQIGTTLLFTWTGVNKAIAANDTLFLVQFRVGSNAPVFEPLLIRESDQLLATLINEAAQRITVTVQQGSVMVTPLVSGNLLYGFDGTTAVSGAIISIVEQGKTGGRATFTNSTGFYKHLLPAQSVQLSGSKTATTKDKEAIDITDIITLQRYIVKLRTFTQYESFLADINRDAVIDVLDAVLLHRIVAGLDDDIANGLWQIMPTAIKSGLPASINFTKSFTLQDGDTTDVDFHAHLIGDLDGSWASSQTVSKSSKSNTFTLNSGNETENNDTYIVRVSTTSEAIHGYQIDLVVPKGLDPQLKALQQGAFLYSKTSLPETDKIRIVWYNTANGIEENTDLFSINCSTILTEELDVLSSEKSKFVDKEGNNLFVNFEAERTSGFKYALEQGIEQPSTTQLLPAYPNPFNPTTTLSYTISSASSIEFTVYSLLGQRIWNQNLGVQAAGSYSISLVATNWSSGTYIVQFKAGETVQTQQITLLK